eukprot:CAMPEP_0114990106 /NCGR_PEP_ID=MMETSP0216-20121206/10590_1 /TAXON_ID=223996 /ORGANISM="Protocruzia adherens, Strain Boccale" /LENGTH=349 /DNA_ID=CAMNT_0002353201 /DNA_START=52 /DNA_END=1101 /DNA_ORIENTATION=-
MSQGSRYYDPVVLQNEQKDQLISQLRQEVYELTQNERDFAKLQDQIASLEHRFNIQRQEMAHNEREFLAKNDSQLREVDAFEREIEMLSAELRDKEQRNDEYRGDISAIKRIIDDRSSDVARLKNEYTITADMNNRLKEEIGSLEAKKLRLKEDKRQNLREIDNLLEQVNKVTSDGGEQNEMIKNLESQISRHNQEIQDLKYNISQTEKELDANNDELSYTEGQCGNARKTILSLQEEVKDLEVQNDRARDEASRYQNLGEDEISKNVELNKRFSNLQADLRDANLQLDNLRKDVDDYTLQHKRAMDENRVADRELSNKNERYHYLLDENKRLNTELDRFISLMIFDNT